MALKRRHRRRVVRWPLAFSDAPAASRGVWFWFGWCLYRGSHETLTEPALGARAAGPMPGSADSRNRGHRANQFYVPVWQSLTISWRMGDRNTSGSLQDPPPWTDTMGRAAGAILKVEPGVVTRAGQGEGGAVHPREDGGFAF